MDSFGTLLGKINEFIINPIIYVLFAVAFIFFFIGLIQVVKGSKEGGDDFAKGKRNMLYGLIGFVVMFGVYGIINLLLGTFGIDTPEYLQGL
ncbi:MAG: hypothetical protein COV34_01355 [Candidatus Zambryskibacteria bacterium CG10_big_fil_rev_8_21_14_0_10_42_12]|uniref:Uncharacterized protein n=1 Tax=Candidatus Zambryskibacteria bacterium CG10_big_fil_rev_8_21_14_0_10_42_12 TaxID=1975115 RepID=A0A2H0QWQ1_9BACT|nr:MAG: hypothetical protein COV34_01355 [Candidatus Zambryskibacteria bacterium CG10_big_fil_rev_8_21_14_0_10_42_12]